MSAEQAIRDYLRFLSDPTSMRDDEEVARLEAAAGAADEDIVDAEVIDEDEQK